MRRPSEGPGTRPVVELRDQRPGGSPPEPREGISEVLEAIEDLNERMDSVEDEIEQPPRQREPVLTATAAAGGIGAILAGVTGYQLSGDSLGTIETVTVALFPLISSLGAGAWARNKVYSPATHERELREAERRAKRKRRVRPQED